MIRSDALGRALVRRFRRRSGLTKFKESQVLMLACVNLIASTAMSESGVGAPREPVRRKHFRTVRERLTDQESAYADGSILALYDAIWLCHEVDRGLPKWAIVGALKVIKQYLKLPQKLNRGGPRANEASERRYNKEHLRRHLLVRRFLDAGCRPVEAYKKASAELKLPRDIPVTWEAVGYSYRLVERLRNDQDRPVSSGRYGNPFHHPADEADDLVDDPPSKR